MAQTIASVRTGSDSSLGSQQRNLRLFRYDSLDRSLRRPHIAGIAFSGTVGIGLFITSGELISFSGSLGCVLGFLIAGIIVIGVMRGLAEMVSVRPLSGALIDYPRHFVDPALGFAVGVTYWICQCMSMVALTSAAARTANYFQPEREFSESTKAGIVTGLLVITLLSNICGVRIYGNLERVIKIVKFLTIITLCIFMVVINVGAVGYPTEDKSLNYTQNSFPPGMKFTKWTTTNRTASAEGAGIPGGSGIFLAVWTSISIAMFACQGGDIVIVSAGEAQHPRRDLPPVTRFMYLVPLSLYVLGTFLVGFNINYTEPDLSHQWLKGFGSSPKPGSPFIIVLQKSSISPHATATVFSALMLFAAYTCSNTALYTASRTLFALAQEFGNRFIQETVGRTSSGHTPIVAIFISWIVGGLTYIGLARNSFGQPILTFSALFTSGIACVYASECIAFMRFLSCLRYLDEIGQLSRDEDHYTQEYGFYRAHWQPFFSILGLVGCVLIILFSGWPSIYILAARGKLQDSNEFKSTADLVWDVVGAYLSPIIFMSLYVSFKLIRRTELVNLRTPEQRTLFQMYPPDPDEPLPPKVKGWRFYVMEVWSFVK